jgi:type IV secretory pathway VirB2 component (pilin)
METIEILALIVAILGVIYIGIDAIFDRMGM